MSEQLPREEDNVHYMDEYPELSKKVWLRRLEQDRAVGRTALDQIHYIYKFTEKPEPDQPA